MTLWSSNPLFQFTESVLKELLLNKKNDQSSAYEHQLQGPLGTELVM